MLINKKKCRVRILEKLHERLPHRAVTCIGKDVYVQLDRILDLAIDQLVHRFHGRKTVRWDD